MIKKYTPVPVAIVGGYGSERHNLAPVMRATLPHVGVLGLDIVNFCPYVSFEAQINAAVKSYIDDYNQRQDERLDAERAKYAAGERKTEPRRSDFPHMGYDYYADHIEDKQFCRSRGKVEIAPMWRSLIIHLGDRDDRISGRIPEEAARGVFAEVAEEFRRRYPNLLLLSAAMHTAEYGDDKHEQVGGWHLHIDYRPIYPLSSTARGLRMGTGLDGAMRFMGYEPEEALVINHHRPLLYNALRNGLYRALESILPRYGMRLQLGVTATKQPDKDPGVNLPMPDWQAHKRETADVQAVKNRWLDVLMADEVSPDSVKQALGSLAVAKDAMRVIQRADRNWDGSAYKLRAADYIRLEDALENMMDTMAHVVAKAEQADAHAEQVEDLTQQLAAMQTANTQLEQEVARLRKHDLDRQIKAAAAERRCLDMQRTIDRMISFMAGIEHGGRKLYDLYNEMFGDDRSKARE